VNFDFSEDQKLLAQTARDYLDENAPLSACREVLESDQPYSRDLWKGAAELGWLGTAIPEEYGGAGFGHLELAVIAEEVGRALAPIPFSSSVYFASEALLLAGTDAQKQKYLPRLASGASIGTFALSEKPGQNGTGGAQTSFEGGLLSGTKLPVMDGDVADFAVVSARSGTGTSLVIADLGGDGVERRPLSSFDPSRSQARLRFEGAPAELLGAEGEGSALAFEITKDFAMGRYAFGRPIASFQVIKHNLAERWCDIEIARSNSYYGAWALSGDEPELGIAASVARIAASDAYTKMSEDMIQIHGGVGYTWEYDCHLFYRRAQLLAAALGNPASWKHKLVDRLRARAA
jgi:alkylation response protein AidB-like acyl-CoA dehydrogenase